MSYWVHTTAKLGERVKLGMWCRIGPNVVIGDDVVIGDHAIIGGTPEHRDFYDDHEGERSKGVIIGNRVNIGPMVTVDAGTIVPTQILDKTVIFNKSHVAHDCYVGLGCIIGGQVSLAGHTRLMEGANVSGKSCTSQHTVIGPYAFIGGFTYVTKNVGPGELWIGNPAKLIGVNEIGLHRANLTLEECKKRWGYEFNKLTEGT